MINILRFFVTFLGFAVVLTLAVLNRGDVSFIWSPLHGPVHLPVMVIILVGVAVGFVWGTVMHWIHAAPARATARVNARVIKDLTDQLRVQEQAAIAAQNVIEEDEMVAPRKRWWRVWR